MSKPVDLSFGEHPESGFPPYQGIVIPPRIPAGLAPTETSHTYFSIYGYWFMATQVKDKALGFWTLLYEYAHGSWSYVAKYHGENEAQSDSKMRRAARQLLLEGHRPEALQASDELAELASFWQANGFHGLARDNH